MALLWIFLAASIGGWIFPWWWAALSAYALGFWFFRRAGAAFAAGFTGTAAAWLASAAYQDWRNHQLLSGRIAVLLHLPSPLAVLGVTALLGGLCGGMGAWAGSSLGAYMRPKFSRESER